MTSLVPPLRAMDHISSYSKAAGIGALILVLRFTVGMWVTLFVIGFVSVPLSKHFGRGKFGPERQLKTVASSVLGWMCFEILLAFRLKHAAILAALVTTVVCIVGSLVVCRTTVREERRRRA